MDCTMLCAAVLVVLIIILFVCCRRQKRGRFASKRATEVYGRAQELFAKGDATYSDYRNAVPGADPVQYTDVRRLHREGTMSPETVEGVL